MGGAPNVINDEQFDAAVYSPLEVTEMPEVRSEGTSRKKKQSPKQPKHNRDYRDWDDDYYD